MQSSFTVERADAERERSEILRLWQLGFPSEKNFEKKFDWFYIDNPAGEPLLYFLKNDGANIGVEGIGPKKWFVKEKRILSGLFVDLAVDPGFRSLGPALRLIREATNQTMSDVPILYGFPNPKSLPVYKRGGFEVLGEMKRYAIPLRHRDYIQKYSKVAAYLFGGVVRNLYKLSEQIRNISLQKSIRCTEGERVSKEFDELWNRKEKKYCMAQRDGEFLTWRFQNHPVRDDVLFTIRSKDTSELLGYIVYKISPDDNVIITDFLAQDDEISLTALFRLFIQKMRKAGHKSISVEFFGEDSVAQVLMKTGFKLRDATPIIYTLNKDKLDADLGSWYLTGADRD